MESDQYLGWLALALTPGLGARMTVKLLQEFDSPAAIFSASLTALKSQLAASPELRMNRQVGCGPGDPGSGFFGGVGTDMRETLFEFEKGSFEIPVAEKRGRHG
jgi:hypothetical protein